MGVTPKSAHDILAEENLHEERSHTHTFLSVKQVSLTMYHFLFRPILMLIPSENTTERMSLFGFFYALILASVVVFGASKSASSAQRCFPHCTPHGIL